MARKTLPKTNSAPADSGPLRYLLLRRVSTPEQEAKDLSLPAQEREQRDHVEKNGGVVVYSFQDVLTGKSDQRDGLQQAITLAKEQKYDVLLVHRSDRIFRNKEHAVSYKHLLRHCGIRLQSVTEAWFGGDDPHEQLMEGIMEAFSEFFVANLCAEVKKGHREVVHGKGRQIGFPPYGYRLADADVRGSQWAVDEDIDENGNFCGPAVWVRWMFQEILKGKRLAEVVSELNISGVPTYFSARAVANRPESRYRRKESRPKVGQGMWLSSTVRAILTNVNHIGLIKYNGETFPGVHQPLIDEETFYAVQRLVESRAKGPVEKSDRGLFVGGLLHCPHCGYPMLFSQGPNKTAVNARKRGEDTSSWPEEKLYCDIYQCSLRSRERNAQRLNGTAQPDFNMQGPTCKGFNISQNTVKKLLFEALQLMEMIGTRLPTKPRCPGHNTTTLNPINSAPISKYPMRRSITKDLALQEAHKALLQKEMASLSDNRKRLQRLVGQGLMTEEELREELDHLEERRSKMVTILNSLNHEVADEPGILGSEQAHNVLQALQDHTLSPVQKRDALRTVIRYAVVSENKKAIKFFL